ncbi:DUF4179 domain-containing protein [Niallia sp. Sow4_A1]|uniref:DUF4179 domain-containing protein n=1 Tax=Niallia hominis TaxID=3133173 RepID=A0ABV1F6K1_9BACI|nr:MULTISPECIES: DUF4179 domain-containing protein [Bacillaceae]MCF2649460.1 DUF4179 domain-containing protein [Niallia circulans]MCM3363827.1 DUF4179 domain-containing protein [Niallia sp. MER TA 168]CAI9391789.1 hypothetical protein BACSP_03122 [Bacillus sp. T2.9-1]
MTDHFDKKVKEMVKDDYMISEQLENKINETLANLPSHKMHGKKKRMIISTAAAAILVLSMVTFRMNPSLAQNIGIPTYLEKFLSLGNDYEKVSLQTSEVQESQGVKLTITNTIFDGYYLLVSYKAEQKDPFKHKPILFPQNAKIVAGDKESFVSVSNEYGDFEDKNNTVYNGVTVFPLNNGSFDFNHEIDSEEKFIEENKLDIFNLPKTFHLQFNLEELGLGLENESENNKIKGNWEFDLPIETVKAMENSKVIDLNKNIPELGNNVQVEKLVITPIRIYLQGLQEEKNSSNLDYVIKDDSGETKTNLGGSVYVNDNGPDRLLSNYENNNPLMKSLTIVPFEYHKEPQITAENSTKFNASGKTNLPIGKGNYITITNVEEKDGKTYLSYHADVPVYEYMPFIIRDKEGKDYYRIYEKNVPSTVNSDAIAVMDGNLMDDDYTIFSPNTYYFDQAFTIDITK